MSLLGTVVLGNPIQFWAIALGLTVLAHLALLFQIGLWINAGVGGWIAGYRMRRTEDFQDLLGMVVLLPAFVAELSFSLWLVVKGVDATRIPQSWSRAPS